MLDYKGVAQFDFQISDGDTILTGDFEHFQSNVEQLIKGKDSYFNFKGRFDNNVPVGDWRFTFGEYKASTTKNVNLNDFKYQVALNGTQHEAYGSLQNGKPNGKWEHSINKIKEGEAESTLFKSQVDFANGIPQKSFEIQNETNTLIGRFLRDGLAHDVWELYSSSDPSSIETWQFIDGILKHVKVKSSDTTYTTTIFNDAITNPVSVNLDANYLAVINLFLKLNSDNHAQIEDGVNSLLSQNADQYDKIFSVLSALGDTKYRPEFKVKLNLNPLTNKELRYINQTKELYEKSSEIATSLLASTQLSLLKLSDQEVAFLTSVIKLINKQYLKTVKEILEYQSADLLKYVPRNSILSKVAQDSLRASFTVSYEFNDSSFTQTHLSNNYTQFELAKTDLEGLSEWMKYLDTVIENINKTLSNKLTRELQEQELMALEEQIIKENDTLNAMIDTLMTKSAQSTAKSFQTIKSFAKGSLSQYSTFENMADKPTKARELIKCFNQLEILIETLALQQQRDEEIKQLYLDEVWNPFTATLMDEEVKRRITNAYFNILQPYLYETIELKLNCANAQDLADLFDKLFIQMQQLRNADTKKLERKLKKENDAVEILSLFSIKNTLQTEGDD
ncbi:hypothetical protein [Fulvivirga lutea]|uniref:Uncharacterized protein n=1 Tax=Fulvivirga lutea TaxID=2810512 RepID=A0A975A065_9BACT|nr:hypothetical protein [Fulvivirga lutea]QSE96476.1 hypothetical protein JR347_12800 [Fulvivirga lutea]